MGERSSGGGSSDRRVSESKLEAELYESMRLLSMTEQGFPMPVREMHPFWCCEHQKRYHLHDGSDWCGGCLVEDPGSRGHIHDYRHGRNWRCDFAWPDRRLIVEVEGGVYSQGRHTRPSGFTKDLEKFVPLLNGVKVDSDARYVAGDKRIKRKGSAGSGSGVGQSYYIGGGVGGLGIVGILVRLLMPRGDR